MTNTLCLRCLTHKRRTPVTLTGDTYRCPVCGFAAQVRTISLDALADEPGLRLGPVTWVGGQAHCVELT